MWEATKATQFDRTAAMLGSEAIEKLKKAKVIIFGIGGVGGFTAEALARAGVGELHLVDKDVVDITNLNRQIIALHSTVGEPKTEVMIRRIADINPLAKAVGYKMFYLPENADEINLEGFDYIVDAIDNIAAKTELAVRAEALEIPIISSMGAGNKLDPTGFQVSDIYNTSVCPLAKAMRKQLKARKVSKLKVVYSREEPVNTGMRTPASVPFIPSVVGLILAGEVIKDLVCKFE